ncbi:helix-turn-helix domain-containing protein [Streptomyces sp. NPDC058108]|uniref:helix-turn-helix domain-containing protein n=1 Tax=Streptomyces sp. NPDC058108 TaxID=3346344 RepID=UPI0036E25BBF
MSDTCEHCGTALAGGPGKGRPRKYCGDACRQAAHRRRLHGDTPALPGDLPPAPLESLAEPRPAQRPGGSRSASWGPSVGDELLMEIAKDIQEGARDLARLLPTLTGEEPLLRVAQLHEQLDGLTAAVVGRARYRRITWAAISSTLRVSEDTARHRYTDRYILRRLARFNRTESALTSLGGLFTGTAPRHGDPAEEAGSDGDTAGGPGAEPCAAPEQQSAPVESSGAAYNRLSPILSMLIRTAQLTNKEVSDRIGCSASYLSRILSGERVPTWDLTRKFARACGADPEVLRTVWESEKLSQKDRETITDPDDAPLSARERLRAAVQTLHLRAGRPAPSDVAVASRWLLSTSAVASVLDAPSLTHQAVLETFVRVLGGDTDHFHQLLDKARAENPREQQLVTHPSAPTPTTPTTGAHPAPHSRAAGTRDDQPAGADAVMKTFSKVLTEDQTVEDGRARLLQKLARQQTKPVRPADTARRRTLTAVADALRHRTPAPPGITPLHTGT